MTTILKLGGGAGNDHSATLSNLAQRIQNGEQWIVVHGCSAATNQLSEDVGYPPQTITSPSGHTSRYTDARTIELFSMAAAQVNQTMTSILRQHGIKAVGLASPNVIFAERKKAIRAIRNGRQVIIRDDYTGKITGADGDLLQHLLDQGYTPVVAPLALGAEYERLNIDGDLAAAQIAKTINADNLIILTNVAGLLRDVDDPQSRIAEISLAQLDQYQDIAKGRMKKKLIAAQTASANSTIIASSQGEAPLDAALDGGGTHIRA